MWARTSESMWTASSYLPENKGAGAIPNFEGVTLCRLSVTLCQRANLERAARTTYEPAALRRGPDFPAEELVGSTPPNLLVRTNSYRSRVAACSPAPARTTLPKQRILTVLPSRPVGRAIMYSMGSPTTKLASETNSTPTELTFLVSLTCEVRTEPMRNSSKGNRRSKRRALRCSITGLLRLYRGTQGKSIRNKKAGTSDREEYPML